jgi:hypothetical protein
MKTTSLQFDPHSRLLRGPGGSLPVPASDLQAQRLLMLIEGECLGEPVGAVAQKYGYCRQRYYQVLNQFKQGGVAALLPQKTGPKSNYRRTDQVVRQVLRYIFLDPGASPEVIAQKLRQTHFPISLRSVQRIIADYGLQKKTLSPQPQNPAPASAHATRARQNPGPARRRSLPRTGGPPGPGR